MILSVVAVLGLVGVLWPLSCTQKPSMSTTFQPDDLDVAERFSQKLDRIPGFRKRTALPSPLAWSLRNPTRQMAVVSAGSGIILGMAVLVFGKLINKRFRSGGIKQEESKRSAA